jgi:hypothetical protein
MGQGSIDGRPCARAFVSTRAITTRAGSQGSSRILERRNDAEDNHPQKKADQNLDGNEFARDIGLCGILGQAIPRYDEPASSIPVEAIFVGRRSHGDWEHSVARQDAAERHPRNIFC